MKDDKVWQKYNEKIFLKAKVKEVDGVIKTNLLGNEVQGESMHCTCIACIIVDSVMRMDKKNYPQVSLEECKYKIKKMRMSRLITAKLESDSESVSESDWEAESKLDTKLMAKLKSDSSSE